MADDGAGSGTNDGRGLLGVAASLPRLLTRTRSQAEFARSALSLIPCVGGLVERPARSEVRRAPATERVDVLTVLRTTPTGAGGPQPAAVEASTGLSDAERPPAEAELPIQDYDSLAASQVVPRLATLDPDDLRSVQSYERAGRNRQTILNRVAQLLAG